jgi:hypothetical protein
MTWNFERSIILQSNAVGEDREPRMQRGPPLRNGFYLTHAAIPSALSPHLARLHRPATTCDLAQRLVSGVGGIIFRGPLRFFVACNPRGQRLSMCS